MASSLSLRGILDTNKLAGPNYIDWLRNLKIILTQEKVSFMLDTPALDSLERNTFEEDRTAYKMWKDNSVTIKCIMLASMSNEL